MSSLWDCGLCTDAIRMLPHWYFLSWSQASSPQRDALHTRRCLRHSKSCKDIGKTLRTSGSTWWDRASRLSSRRSYLPFRTFWRIFPCSECRLWCLIVRHCSIVSARSIYFKLEAAFFLRIFCPTLPILQKKRITSNQAFRSKPRRLLGDRTCEDFNRTKSSVSIAGLCFTFSFPWRFKLTTLAFSTSFDLLTLGQKIALGLCLVAVHSSIFQLSGELQGA